ncbi:MAG: phosphoenolpyruvate--protein phosphotransferase, partial [Lachnospiraceae bacterium]|nr:phosphoenolpyruvate--protein phosphotransferase [Lachnospiraceae bacterium]
RLKKLVGQDNVTTYGSRVNVYCNIGNEEDAERVLAADGGGIGLFRSEFLYLGRDTAPTEEEQFKSYRTVLEKMGGKKVIIRTLDIGADKRVDYLGLEEEENPALGYRAIRICLDREDLFRTQLRAIYRASAFGTASIMFPMIISVDEIRRIKDIVESVKSELASENIAMGEVELGIMIETPAAALISDELAKEVDFFSIGTNDLTQYTLAIDRQNQKLEKICDTHHKAVLKLIQMTVENGHREKIWVGICGELAGDLSLTRTFVDMGVDELSVSPTYVLELRKAIREI